MRPRTAFLTRFWLALAIPVVAALAVAFPGPALALPKIHATDLGVVVVMFLGSLKIRPGRFVEAGRRLDLVVLALASVFFLAPLLAIGLAAIAGLGAPDDRIAVLLCAANSSTLATAVVLTEIASGDVALAMILTVTNSLASVVLTPLAFRLFGGASVAVDVTDMMLEMALKVLLPIVAGQAARRPLGALADRHARGISIVSQLIILTYVFTGMAAGAEALEGRGTIILARVALFVILLHAALLAGNALLARTRTDDPGGRAAFVLCTSQRTLPVAIMLWQSHFPALPLGPLVSVAYHALQLVADSMLAPSFLRLPLVRGRPVPTQEVKP